MASRNKSASDVTRLNDVHLEELDFYDDDDDDDDDAISLNFTSTSSPRLQRTGYFRHSSLTDEVYRMNNARSRKRSQSPKLWKHNSLSQLSSRNSGSATSVSRFFNSMSAGFNRLSSTASLTSLLSSSSSDGSCGFAIPTRTIPPRPANLTAQAELISHIEKRKTKGYHDVILNEVRDGRIIDSHIERPISETLSKIDQWFPVSSGLFGTKF